jgi:Right handed beta helix region
MWLTKQSKSNRLARIALGTMPGAALAVLVATLPAQAAALPACATVITACGCAITDSAIHTAGNDLSAAQTKQTNCIEITKDHAILNLKGFRVTGRNVPGSIGVLIRRAADHVIVEGGDEADNDPPQNPAANDSDSLPNKQAVVSKWDIGIEDDADDAIIELFNAIGGEALLPHHTAGNVTGGVLLKSVTNSLIGDFRASFNGKFGVRVEHSSNIHIANVTTRGNGETGIQLDSSNNNVIGPTTSPDNTKYGTWLSISSNNTIHDSADDSNNNTGILMGCGFNTKNCPGNQTSDHNRMVNSGATGNKQRGVVVRKHSSANIITVNHNDGNGAEKMDMVDENNKCDSNTWYNNTGQGNQPCIH